MRPNTVKQTLQALLPNIKTPVLLVGPPGVGKTDIVKQTAANLGWDLLITHPVVDQPIDYKGLPSTSGGDARFLPYGHLKQMVKTDRPTIVFFDDLGQASNSVQAAAMQLLLERKIGEHNVSEHVRFVAATNRREDKAAVMGLIEPLKSRMIILQFESNPEDWIEWAMKNGIDPTFVAFIKFKPQILFNHNPTPEIKNSPSPRTVAHAARAYEALVKSGHDNQLIVREVITGAAGEGFASEFMAFLKMRNELPNIKQLLSDANMRAKFKAPERADLNYVLIGALLQYASKNNTPALCEVLDKMDKEYKNVFLFMITKREEDLPIEERITRQPEFLKWLMKNAISLGINKNLLG